MGALITFPGIQSPSPWTLPTIFTPQRIERMGKANSVARTLRELGYRIVAEDPYPDDDGSPIIQIELGHVGPRAAKLLADCAVRNANTGIERITVDGVRVFWTMEQA